LIARHLAATASRDRFVDGYIAVSGRQLATEVKEMTRKIRILGLALVAILVLGSVVASGASALKPHLTVESYPATLSGQQTGENNVFTLEGGRKTTCENVKYSGTYTETQAKGESGSVVTPEYINCTTTILGNPTPSTVTLNGCRYNFTANTYVNETEATGTEEHVECPEGKKMESHVWQTSAKHLANETALCTYAIGSQTATGTFTYKITGTAETPHTYGTSTTKATISVSRTGGTVTNCGAATQTGSIEAAAKVEAKNSKGELEHPTWKNE
jgi:hypothetical protein